MKRTWYFLRRNSLALVGLGVVLFIAAVAVYAVFQPYDWYEMPQYCATDYNSTVAGPTYNSSSTSCSEYVVCTYEQALPTNYLSYCNGQWFKVPSLQGVFYPGAVPPTDNLNTFQPGPMPLGGLSPNVGSAFPVIDIYSGLVRGSDWSLIFSISIVGIGATVGLLVGAIAGLWGGVIDEVLMRIVDIFLSIPVLLFVIVTITVVLQIAKGSPSLQSPNTQLMLLVLGFAVTWWPFYARIVRGQVLVVREQKYVEAARAAGAGRGRILTKHVIPNSLYPVFIQFSLDVGQIPLLFGSLVFLGFKLFPGNTPYFPEWGAISAQGIGGVDAFFQQCTQGACFIPWWQFFFPGMILFAFAISVNLLSDGLRDALDPRLRR